MTDSPDLLPGARPRTLPRAAAVVLDAVCVVAFAMGGRSSHDEQNSLVGVLTTAWPFLVGLAAGWVLLSVVAVRRDRAEADAAHHGRASGPTRRAGYLRVWPWACGLVASTWALGMGLRVLSDQGVSGGFPLVALAFLTATLLGWRLVALAVSRRGSWRSPAPAP